MIAVWLVVVSLMQAPSGTAKPATPTELVAIVSALEGKIWAQAKPSRRTLALYDWLHAGTVIDLDADARAVLIMMNGKRYELGGGSRVQLTDVGNNPARAGQGSGSGAELSSASAPIPRGERRRCRPRSELRAMSIRS